MTARVERLLSITRHDLVELCDVLIDGVEAGASISFVSPMTRDKAEHYWTKIAHSLEQGERIVMVARDSEGVIIGTAQVVLDQPENQPHRGDLSKMIVHRRARKHGAGAALLSAAESAARAAGKTLLVLDTASADAARLYERGGWQRCGEIPDYALLPDGTPSATIFYFKRL